MPLLSRSSADRSRPGRWQAPTAAISAVVVLPSLLLAACLARRPPARSTTLPLPSAFVPAETRIGVVRVIGPEGRFVLIETPSALATSALAEGQLLHSRPSDALARTSTADLRISRERHQTLVVANVVAGEPAIDAVVYSTPNPPSSATPAPDPITDLLPVLAPTRHP